MNEMTEEERLKLERTAEIAEELHEAIQIRSSRKRLANQLRQIARDVLTISSVVSIFFAIVWTFTKPYLIPFLQLPTQVGHLQSDVAQLRTKISDSIDPRLLDFLGHGIVVGNNRSFKPGESFTVAYLLRRNASCEADIRVTFINLDTGTPISNSPFRAIKAPVTDDYFFFKVPIRIPPEMEEGNYVYKPIIVPIECGVYKEFTTPMSDPFMVKK